MTRPQRVTLHHVAAKAGVSIATVSRALNRLPVAAENLERVERAALELGYVPNEAARSLRSDRTLTLGMIFHELSDARALEWLDALSRSVDEAGYSLLIATARGDAEAYDVLMRRFLERRVDGLFCIQPQGPGSSLARYEAAGVPVLNITSRNPAFAELPAIEPTIVEAATAVAVDLGRFGHKRIAWLDDRNPDAAPTPDEAWDTGPFEIQRVVLDDYRDMDHVLDTLLSAPDRPTVVSGFDTSTASFLAACRLAGVSVPGDFSVISVRTKDDERRDKTQRCSALILDSAPLAEASSAAMLRWLSGEPPEGVQKVEVGAWVPRDTVGPAG